MKRAQRWTSGIGAKPAAAIVALHYRSVDYDLAPVEVTHRMDRCWLKGDEVDEVNAQQAVL